MRFVKRRSGVRQDSSANSKSVIETLEDRRLMSAALSADVSQLVFGDVVGGPAAAARTVKFTNNTPASVSIPGGAISISGASASQFDITSAPTSPLTLAPGASFSVSVNFGATVLGPQGATLNVTTDAGEDSTTSVALRGLGTPGEQGSFEPSLQWILDTYQIASRTGDTDPAESTLDLTPLANDEVIAPLFTRAGPGPVSVEPIAVYSNAATPALILGWYTKSTASSSTTTKNQVFTVMSSDVQTLNPRLASGTTSFDPGTATFGLYSTWPAQNNRTVYGEDARNTFISPESLRRMFKVYPLTDANGAVVPNAYVVGNEEAFNHDYQDAVFVIRNVVPRQSFPATAPVAQVASLTLVNADTGKDIGALTSGQTIDFSQLGTTHLSVRATMSGTPGSIKFVDGGFSHIENSAPYTINGDSGTSYTAWTPALGANTLTVTPYSATNAGGTAGTPFVVNFTVQAQSPTPTPTPTPTPSPTTVLNASADAFGRDGTYATTNYGAATRLQLKKGAVGWTRESFLKFDLTSISSVSSAKLRLYGMLDNTTAASVGFSVFASTNNGWSESTVNWNTRPTSSGTALANGTVVGTAGKWYELDLTAFLKQQKAAGATSVTLVLKASVTSNATILFDSNDGANGPQLVVQG
jgi:hypothetical protein